MPQVVSLAPSRIATLRSGAVLVRDTPAILWIEGSGALACLQGLVTQDLEGAGTDSLSYAALLTPKGMIIADLWVVREASRFLLVFDRSAREAVLAHLGKTLPPRLARVGDLSESWRADWFLGSASAEHLARALSHEVPGAGRIVRIPGVDGVLAGGTAAAPFRILALGPEDTLQRWEASFGKGVGRTGDATDLAAARVLAGWPALGREIDEKTLPQEVRFEENGGVSYTKGCYTGQETVARIHFRGHVNRVLRGFVLHGSTPPDDPALRLGERELGRVGTCVAAGDRLLCLAMVRREVEPGTALTWSDRDGIVAALPLDPDAAG